MDLFAKRAIQVSVFGVPGCSSRLFPPFLDFLPLYGSVVLRFEIFFVVPCAWFVIPDSFRVYRPPVSYFWILFRYSGRLCVGFRFSAVVRSARSIFFDFFRLHDFQRSVRLPVPHSRCVWRPPARTRGVSGPGGRDSRE